VHSVKLCISGNLSVGSVTLYKSVWHCIGKGWFADVVLTLCDMDSEGCLYPSSWNNLSTDLVCVLCISFIG